MKLDRYQTTFVMGTKEKGAKVEDLLNKQAERLRKIFGRSKPSPALTLRVALRTLATVKDKDVVLDDEE